MKPPLIVAWFNMVITAFAFADNPSARPLEDDVRSGTVDVVEFFFAAYDINTFVAISPESLRKTGACLRVQLGVREREALLQTLSATRLKPIDHPPDLRSAAVFFDREGRELHAVYLDGRFFSGTGRRGIFDGQAVKLNGALQKWIQHYREECERKRHELSRSRIDPKA